MANEEKLCTSFDIVFEEKVVAKCPKKKENICKEPLTLEQIEEKQILAEERRQARLAARIKRIKERDEATKHLAQSVAVLLEQQALRNGELSTGDSSVSKMSQQELLKTANNVARGFKVIQQQLLGSMDLKIDEKTKASKQNTTDNCNITDGKPSTCSNEATEKITGIDDKNQSKSSVWFDIPVEAGKRKLGCKQQKIAEKEGKGETRKVLANELNEKQERATERRKQIMDRKVRKTREAREALMELQVKINVFKQHQQQGEEGNSERVLSDIEAACLAHEIADGFSNITSRYESTLDRAEGLHDVIKYIYCNK